MVAFSEDESSEEESSDSDAETRTEDDVQYVDLMLALAEGAAKREGVEEGRKQGLMLGAAISFVCFVIFLFLVGTPLPDENCETALRACQQGCVSLTTSWNPFAAVVQRDAALVAASSSWISSVLTPELALRVPAWRVAPVWAGCAVLLAAAQYMGFAAVSGTVGMLGLLLTGRALPDLWSATTLGNSFSLQTPWEAGASALGNAAAGWQPGFH